MSHQTQLSSYVTKSSQYSFHMLRMALYFSLELELEINAGIGISIYV